MSKIIIHHRSPRQRGIGLFRGHISLKKKCGKGKKGRIGEREAERRQK